VHEGQNRGHSVIPSHLIELGHETLAAVTTNVASGAPLVRCQLLASDFFEALKRELRVTSQLSVIERAVILAAVTQCREAATEGISPGVLLVKLRSAFALLQSSGPMPSPQDHVHCYG
jgi:hypothetical protein